MTLQNTPKRSMQGRIYSKFLLRQKENHEKRQQTQVSSRQK